LLSRYNSVTYILGCRHRYLARILPNRHNIARNGSL